MGEGEGVRGREGEKEREKKKMMRRGERGREREKEDDERINFKLMTRGQSTLLVSVIVCSEAIACCLPSMYMGFLSFIMYPRAIYCFNLSSPAH